MKGSKKQMVYKQFDLFTNQPKFIPQTEGIKYAGSKLKIIPFIIQLISELPSINSVLDGFTGTTRVAQAFAQLGYDTTANDIAVWSEVFANCYLKSSKPDNYYQEIIDESYIISKVIHTSYVDILDISIRERDRMLELINEENKRNREDLDKLKTKSKR